MKGVHCFLNLPENATNLNVFLKVLFLNLPYIKLSSKYKSIT